MKNKPSIATAMMVRELYDCTAGSASLLSEEVVNTSSNPISELLKQFVSFTSGTSSGFANVMSTQLYNEAPWTAVSMTWIVALSPILTDALTGSGTCGRQKVPGYGCLVGPMIWKAGTMGLDMLGGTVPKPILMYMKAVAWPENQPGWRAMAPPWTGQGVRLVDVGMPP